MKPTEELMKEHEGILLMLDILGQSCRKLEQQEKVEHADLVKMVDFIKVFADGCHHAKEEGYLFPAMERAGVPREHGPIGVMLAEHDLGRKFVRGMAESLAGGPAGLASDPAEFIHNARSYIHLLSQHIQKENMVLFPMADRVLSDEVKSELSGGFERVEEEKVGHGKHEEYHALLKELKSRYLV
jgi:hemerythrin-like domain-containing protein